MSLPLFSRCHLQKWRHFFADFLALQCLNCQQKSLSPLCAACAAQMPQFVKRCRCCTAPNIDIFCQRCQKNRPPLDFLAVRWQYQSPVKDWIWRAKFHADRAALQILSDEAERAVEQLEAETFHMVIPMPIASLRLAQRGFNQTLFPARAVAKKLAIPLQENLLCRVNRPQQAKAGGAKKRAENIKQAFFLSSPPAANVLLIDDVFTTGATLFEAARTLKAGGAKKVGAVVIAGKKNH